MYHKFTKLFFGLLEVNYLLTSNKSIIICNNINIELLELSIIYIVMMLYNI